MSVQADDLGASVTPPSLGRSKQMGASALALVIGVHDERIHDEPGPAMAPRELHRGIVLGRLDTS